MEASDPLAVAAAPEAPSGGSGGDAVRLLLRARRQLKWDSGDKPQEGRTTTVAGFIDWGPTGTDGADDNGKQESNATLSAKASTAAAAATAPGATASQRTLTAVTTPESKRLGTTEAAVGETVKPPKPYGDAPGKTSGGF